MDGRGKPGVANTPPARLAATCTSHPCCIAPQAALDYCTATCGKVVVDKPGVYLTGSLRISGCVHLELPAGVTLLAGDQVRWGRYGQGGVGCCGGFEPRSCSGSPPKHLPTISRTDLRLAQPLPLPSQKLHRSSTAPSGAGLLLHAHLLPHTTHPSTPTPIHHSRAQRQDYPGGQASWYLLDFSHCHRCSLSGAGTVDGGGRKWVLPTPPRRHLKGLELGPGDSGSASSDGGSSSKEPATKAVRNFDDPSCPNRQECRCADEAGLVGVWHMPAACCFWGVPPSILLPPGICCPPSPTDWHLQASAGGRGGLQRHIHQRRHAHGCVAGWLGTTNVPQLTAQLVARCRCAAALLPHTPDPTHWPNHPPDPDPNRPVVLGAARVAQRPREHQRRDGQGRLGHPCHRRCAGAQQCDVHAGPVQGRRGGISSQAV